MAEVRAADRVRVVTAPDRVGRRRFPTGRSKTPEYPPTNDEDVVETREVVELMNRGQVQGAGPRPRDVVGAALRTYRERFWRVAGTAFVVFGIVAAVDALATVLVIDRHVSRPIAAAVTSAVASVFAMVGVVIYAGILDKVVGAHLHGHRDLSVPQIWSVLPLRRLVIADVVLAVATLVGLALFVVPGVVVFTVCSPRFPRSDASRSL